MITPYKNRTIDETKKVEVYRNLHNNKFSIRQNGLVVAHGDSFVIQQVTPKVSETGRQRVIREKQKNVHAVLVGFIPTEIHNKWFSVDELVELYYNPYRLESFINIETQQYINHCDYVYFENGKAYILDKVMFK